MARADAVRRGREAFAERRWRSAYEQLSAADRDTLLEHHDVERLATSAYLVGQEAEATALWTRLHHELVGQGEVARAARFGFWLSFSLFLRGEASQSAGWLGRTQRLLGERPAECVEQGYLLVVPGLQAMARGDPAEANASFERAVAIASRFGDRDLLAAGLLGRGQALIQMQEIARGAALLDEAMIGVTAGEVSPILAGTLYCAAILTCQRIFDFRRAKEWTTALARWCAAQPDLVPFRGECLVYRAEILQLQGDWAGALEEAERACQQLSDRLQRIAGRAFYRRAELHRLRGELELADQMYREAGRNGYEPQPGASLLRLAQGQQEAAAAAIRRVLAEAGSRQGPGAGLPRPIVLGPYVEVMLATDPDAARAAAEELLAIAAASDAPFLRATAAEARGTVLLADGDAGTALASLREAWTAWQQLDAPYESARVRVLIGLACRQLGDADTAHIHFEAACSVFERLGAAPDLSRVQRLAARPASAAAGLLTSREMEVLVLVASGKTNREIAAALRISQHTVARHLSNIFTKVGVTSRTAASAFAYEHDLI